MNVVPFGLCNSQSTFQRVWDTALANATNTKSYVDDCITQTMNFEQHLKDLRVALGGGLLEARTQLRKDKCHFGYEEGEFLGHIISSRGHRPSPGLTNKLSTFQRHLSR